MKKDIREYIRLTFGMGIFQLKSLIVIVLLNKVFSISEVGIYSYSIIIISPIMMFANMQLKTILSVDVEDKFPLRIYLLLRFLLLSIVLLVVVGTNIFFFTSKSFALLIILLSRITDSFFDIMYGELQKKGELDIISNSLIVRFLSFLLLFVAQTFFIRNFYYSLLGLFLSELVVVFYYYKYLIVSKNDLYNHNGDTIYRLFLKALPLGGAVLIGSLITNLPRYYVEYFAGSEELGRFSSMSFLAIGLFYLLIPVQTFFRTKLADARKHSLSQFNKMFTKIIFTTFFFIFIIIVLVFGVGEYLLINIFSDEYKGYGDIFLLLCIGYGLVNIVLIINMGLHSLNEFSVQLKNNIIVIIFAMVSGFFLVGSFGLDGASLHVIVYSLIYVIVYYHSFSRLVYEK